MPSSHMTVIVAITFYLILKKEVSFFVKFIMIGLCVLQGIARVNLHYHTHEQVFGGVAFGIGFSFLFFKLFDFLWPKVKFFIP
jgi:membrane-associated phospholipid phosphatase